MRVVAIGGGEIGRPGTSIETREIDEEIVRISGKKHPKTLLLPTASGDDSNYYETFSSYYGSILGCLTDVLHLFRRELTPPEIERKVLHSDIIYVGGGNTLRMLKLWRRRGLDNILRKAGDKGVVLSGVSAGAICWFAYGNSDSRKFGSKRNRELIRLRGLGFLPWICCPHYDTLNQRENRL